MQKWTTFSSPECLPVLATLLLCTRVHARILGGAASLLRINGFSGFRSGVDTFDDGPRVPESSLVPPVLVLEARWPIITVQSCSPPYSNCRIVTITRNEVRMQGDSVPPWGACTGMYSYSNSEIIMISNRRRGQHRRQQLLKNAYLNRSVLRLVHP